VNALDQLSFFGDDAPRALDDREDGQQMDSAMKCPTCGTGFQAAFESTLSWRERAVLIDFSQAVGADERLFAAQLLPRARAARPAQGDS